MMDRAREGRRTGGGGGSISAPRRPRTTGFKDSPVRDDDEMTDEVHNSRLRERIKKDSLVSVIPGTALRNKRKRQEMQVPAHSSAADEVDESTDETDGGVSEEDDDPPPPIPRWSGKPRPSKFAEEGIGLDLPAVPRKARSAIVKRHQESPQPPNATTPPHHSPSTPAPSNTPSSSGAAAKPGRRMKPNGSKPRPAKVPKSSSAPISEQEVEVAEALFDLHRMVPNFQKVPSESKLESKPERVSASPVRVPSPAQTAPTTSTTLLSPSSASPIGPTNTLASGGSHPAEAPRRKKPRGKLRPEEGGPIASVRSATNVGSGAGVSHKGEHEQGSRSSGVDRTIVKPDSAAKLPGPNSASTVPTAIFQVTGVSTSVSCSLLDHHDGQMKKAEATSETKPNSGERRSALGDSVTPALNSNSDPTKRKFQPAVDIRPAKFEIDLMAPPTSSLPNDLMEISADIDRKETVDLQGGSSELSWLEKERERLKERDKELTEKEEHRDLKTEENHMKQEPDLQKEILKDERECLDLNKHGMGVLRSAKGPRVDAKSAQKPDRSVSAAVVSAASSFLNATASTCTTTPTPMSMASWPGGLPSVGYYGPAAAAVAAAAAVVSWPQAAAAASLSGTSAEENNASHAQMVPYSTGRQSWKRCAIHVFIARFIDLQQQMARHSLMAATYGASAYGGKPYNLNIPADPVFGNGAISVSGAPPSNAMGSNVSSGLPLGAISGVSANAQGSKNGPYMEALFRKHPAQQQQQHAVQGQAFGFPVTQTGGSMPSSATAPANPVGVSGNALSSVSPGSGGNSTPAVAGAGAGSSSVASMAAQAQFFQAVMQHNAFPFPFPASHFGSHNFNGGQNLGQQAAQFVNNPFFTHLVHPPQPQQQSQGTSSVLTGTSQKSQQQGGRIFSNLGSAQQQPFSSPSAYNSPQQNLTAGEKEASTHREAGDNKIPSFQRIMFSQQSANNGAPNLNIPPSSVLGTDVPSAPQDFSSLAGKHVGKSPVLQQGSSQHSVVPPQLHQAAGHGTATLQMSLKNLDSQSSQVSTSMATVTRGSVGPGPLGLAPVAAVMAPQGHTVLQSMADQARLHSQHQHNQSQPHLHSMQPGQQQPRSLQRPEESSEGNNQGNADERKLSAKRISRVDLESLPSMQGSPTSGNSSSRMGNAGPAMNLLTPAGSISSRLNAHPTQGGGGGAVVQSPSQNAKQVAVRAKAPLTSVSASAVTSFGDRTAMNRVSGPGMSFPAQGGMTNLQGSKQGQVPASQHPQLKLSQRPSVASVPGTSVLAAAMPKNQVQPSRSPQGSVNIAGAPRIPVSSAPPASASPKHGSVTQKNAAKGSFPLSQKPSVASGKRSAATPSSSTLLNSSSASQNQSTKTMQLQQQIPQPSQQASSPQQATAQQYQAHLSQQQANHMQKQSLPQAQMRQQQMFFQQQYLQQQQPQQHLTAQQQGLVQQSHQQLAQSHAQAAQQQQNQLQGTTSPSANGLLGSQGLPLGSSSNGTSGRTAAVDSSFSQGMMSKSAPATRTASGSPATSMSGPPQRVNGMQTGSPNTIQQQSTNFPVAHAYSSGGTSVKSSEQKNDATPEQSNNLRPTPVPSTPMASTMVSSPMKTSNTTVSGFPNQAPGRQQSGAAGAGKSVNYGEGGMVPRVPSSTVSAGQSSSLPTSNSSSSSAPTYNGAASSDVRVNFVTSTPMHQQSPASSHQPSMSLVAATPIAVAASSGTPGLLGQSSASALRP